MSWSKKIIALFFLVSVFTPSLLLSEPPPAHAQFGGITFDPTNFIENTISAAATVASKLNEYALIVKQYVLDPIAFVESGNALRAITAGVVDFVNGKTNGTGSPQNVRDLAGFKRSVRDVQAAEFFLEFGKNSNSPFASALISSLRRNYLLGSSAAGFWAENQCTLNSFSANINSYLAGNFAQGGWSTWFALTQAQNNPYLLYYRAQAELYGRTENAVANQLTQLTWGNGFLSWCSADQEIPSAVAVTGSQLGDTGGSSSLVNSTDLSASIQAGSAQSGLTSFAQGANGSYSASVSQSFCPDGSAVQTPGSVIHDALQKSFGSDVDKLVGVGTSGEVTSIFQNLASVLNTVAYGSSLFGGGSGLAGFGASPAATRPGYLGTTAATIQQQQQAAVQAQQNQAQTQYQQQKTDIGQTANTANVANGTGTSP